jgi:prepilin peptidase CpaA
MTNITLSESIVVAVAFVASVIDLRSARIPNRLTFGAAAAALAFHGATGGWTALGTACLGSAAGVLLFFPLFALGGLGAGDVKLLGAIGAWLGPHDVFWVAVYTSIAGGVMAIAVALAKGYLRQAAANLRLLFTHWRVMGIRPLEQLSLKNERAPRLAYALPIAVGVLVTLWLH